MKIGILLLTALATCTCFQAPGNAQSAVRRGVDAITPDLMRTHIDTLASDAMMGRATPSPGLDSAAAYIAREFDRLGVGGCNGTRFQSLNMTTVRLGDDNHLIVTRDGTDLAIPIKTGFIPYDVTGDKRALAHAVFVGYGITAPEYHYDDYAGVDVAGKIVVMLRHEPGEEDTASVFRGRKSTEYSSNARKVRTAIDHGAAGVIIITDPLNHINLQPTGYPWPSLTRFIPKDAVPTTIGETEADKVPAVHAGEEFVKAAFGSVDALRALQRRIDAGMKPCSYVIPDLVIDLKTQTVTEKLSANNVVGFIEGSDPALKRQALVIGGHYDHVGFKKKHSDREDYIFNGADDNASGTAGVLALARAFATAPDRPRRSVLFLLFAAEERGLLGSKVYVDHPLVPLDSTVAMLNLDMISRNDPDTLYIVDSSLSPALFRMVREENGDKGFTLARMGRSMFGGSDHMSFHEKGVPVMFFFTGLHHDYHQEGDNPDRIDADKAARVARLAFRTAWRIANGERITNKEE